MVFNSQPPNFDTCFMSFKHIATSLILNRHYFTRQLWEYHH
jgi:hypothetical protein